MSVADAFDLAVELETVPSAPSAPWGRADTVALRLPPRMSSQARPHRTPFSGVKRAYDLVAAVILLVLFFPVMVVAAIAIRATSPGPALFVQWRVGRHGRLFRMYKLRTMVEDAEKGIGPVWAQAQDPRCTPIGRFLRDTHVDELPQLWNVIKGDMSLVGPRPERPVFVQDLSRSISSYPVRLEVRPGITGLAQVHHGYDRTVDDVRRKLAYDRLYIRRMCLLLDLKILFKTLGKTVPPSSGAAV